jgi:hypothetical protein
MFLQPSVQGAIEIIYHDPLMALLNAASILLKSLHQFFYWNRFLPALISGNSPANC